MMDESRLELKVDKLDLAELVRLERQWRDKGEWQKLEDCYVEDSHVRTTWFSGSAHEFSNHARKMTERGGGRPSKHMISPVEIDVQGDRAVVESLGEIHNRDELEGVPIDSIQYCRFLSRAIRTGAGWRLVTFEGIYQKDVMTPVFPGDVIPIDREQVAGFRAPYRLLAYRLSRK